MRINEETVLVGEKVVLVPYRKEHVERYNEWMQSPDLQEQTASEPLTLKEEYDMQDSWWKDEDKLTFIILHRPNDIKTSELTTTELISQCPMAGDVNVFFSDWQDDDEDEEGESGASQPVASTQKRHKGELEIMIADSNLRRHHLASEALTLLLWYIASSPTPTPSDNDVSNGSSSTDRDGPLPIPASALHVKISLSNAGSIALFEKLGFVKTQVSEAWQEVEMWYRGGTAKQEDQAPIGKAALEVRRWAR